MNFSIPAKSTIASSFVATSFEQPLYTADVDGLGVTRILESIRDVNPQIRFYQASTSEMFGLVQHLRKVKKHRFIPEVRMVWQNFMHTG